MKLRRILLLGLSFVVVLAVPPATHARLLHQSARIALYTTKAESGIRNSHPVTLEAHQLSAALSRLRARSGETGEIIDLFPKKNCEEAAVRLAKELRRIDPDQELHLVSFRSIGSFFLGHRNASAARVFMEKGRLNLLFGQIDLLFSEFRDPDKPIPPMGSRKHAASLKGEIIPTAGVTFVDGRNDWVALDLVRASSLPPAATPFAIQSDRDRTPEAKSPREPIKPREKSIEEKLRILKDLRDKGLITDQEYKDKKWDTLDSL